MNKYLLIIKMNGQIFMTNHNSQHSMSREATLVQKENNITLNLIRISNLEWECCLTAYPDNTAFAVTMGIDAAIIPMTDAQIDQYDHEIIASWSKEKQAIAKEMAKEYEKFAGPPQDDDDVISCPDDGVETYQSPFDGRQK